MNQEKDDFDCSTVTEFLVFVHAFLIGLFIIFGVFFLIFTKIEASDFIFFGRLIAVSLLIIGVVWLCKLLWDFIHRKLKVEPLTKYRNDYLIAFGTIGIFTVVLRILAYFPELSKTSGLNFVYLISIPAIYCFFVRPTFDKKCTWIQMDGTTSDKFICTNLLINVVLLIICIKIKVQYYDTETGKDIIGTQMLLFFPSAFAFAEFAQILLMGVRLINVNEGRNQIAVQPVESIRPTTKITVKPAPVAISKAVAPKPSCNICSFPYTETGIHTPRQIKECGHTICEQCANKLLNVKMQNLLVCPFCQKPTIVNGLAGTLPKNFALLEYSRDVVQRN